ncbi:hypothetical protein CTA2_1017 [Colletotrichum tanaceti]|nr:hypothetical protein CTA2_1017 [Colletotrichum tanaceti]
MDRGPLEKEKAQSIKLEIARGGFKRKRPRLYKHSFHDRRRGGLRCRVRQLRQTRHPARYGTLLVKTPSEKNLDYPE